MYLRPQRFEPLGAFFVPGLQTSTEHFHFLCCPTMSFMAENPKRALLVIDVQNEYFTGKLPITYPAGSLANVLSGRGRSEEAFSSFFKEADLFKGFGGHEKKFYKNVRCGILHQAEATGRWTISRKGPLFDPREPVQSTPFASSTA